ncbi:hypothetical protein VTL71DRAFT_2189 [Oculimacula yallundae]|uniref:Clr5 domain-containing protein n=1 Tax=Oculimacula yallundae TaxID=86028 RepID=A0ABR4C867_9HELO
MDSHPTIIVGFKSQPRKRKQLSKDEWTPELQAFIIKLYIKESKTLRQVMEIVNEKTQFEPTKSQLTRRLKQWGVWKNSRSTVVCRASEPSIQKSLDMNAVLDIGPTSMDLDAEYHNTYVSPPTQLHTRDIPMGFIEEADPENQPVPRITPGNFSHIGEDGSVGGNEGGFGLAELFELLEIEATGLPRIQDILASPKQSVDDRTSVERRNFTAMILSRRPYALPTSYLQDRSHLGSISGGNYTGILPSGSKQDTWFPGSVLDPPNPFSETYLFPSAKRDEGKYQQNRQRQQSETRFHKMLGQFTRPLNEATLFDLKTKYSLALLNSRAGKYAKAEEFYRYIIESVKANVNNSRLDMSRLELALCETIHLQGRPREVMSRIEQLHQHIIKMYPVNNELVHESLMMCIKSNKSSGEREAEERYCRELVQITMGLFGPKHSRTLYALLSLSSFMDDQGAIDEAVRLHSIIIQLQHFGQFSQNVTLGNMHVLLLMLPEQGRSREATALFPKMISDAERLIGAATPLTVNLNFSFGLVLREAKMYDKARRVLQETVVLSIKVYGEQDIHTLNIMRVMAINLKDCGQLLAEIPDEIQGSGEVSLDLGQ